MYRRTFMVLVGAAAGWPLAATAQQTPIRLIGLLSPFSSADADAWHRAFENGLNALGWTEGVNLRIESRYADGRAERLPKLVAELVALKVDVIVTSVTNDALVAKAGTAHIPIVMAAAGDP